MSSNSWKRRSILLDIPLLHFILSVLFMRCRYSCVFFCVRAYNCIHHDRLEGEFSGCLVDYFLFLSIWAHYGCWISGWIGCITDGSHMDFHEVLSLETTYTSVLYVYLWHIWVPLFVLMWWRGIGSVSSGMMWGSPWVGRLGSHTSCNYMLPVGSTLGGCAKINY